MEESEEKLLSKKNIITFLAIGIAALVIPLGVKLLQQQQLLRSRASADPVVFTGENVKVDGQGKYTTTSPDIQVELRASELGAPFGPPAQP